MDEDCLFLDVYASTMLPRIPASPSWFLFKEVDRLVIPIDFSIAACS
jgi:hypothetical protein